MIANHSAIIKIITGYTVIIKKYFFLTEFFVEFLSSIFWAQFSGYAIKNECKIFIFVHCSRLVNFIVITNDRRSDRRSLISDCDRDWDRKKVTAIRLRLQFLGIAKYTDCNTWLNLTLIGLYGTHGQFSCKVGLYSTPGQFSTKIGYFFYLLANELRSMVYDGNRNLKSSTLLQNGNSSV